MQPDFAQPDASPIPQHLVRTILTGLLDREDAVPTFTLSQHNEFSNDLAVATLADGRRLVVKRGRYPGSAKRFETAHRAAAFFAKIGVAVPVPVTLPGAQDGFPLDAYWRIERPTLAESWPQLDAVRRRSAMRSLGELIRRSHRRRFRGHGEFRVAHGLAQPISQVLAEELGGWLMPAARTSWADGIPLVDFLLSNIPEVARRTDPRGVLLHGDLHMGNVLCEVNGKEVHCVGFLDLECAHAGPRESDIARLSIMHTDLFGMPAGGPWLVWALEGYAETLDAFVLEYYSIYHLVQLAFHSLSVGHDVHAEGVVAAARAGVAAFSGMSESARARNAPDLARVVAP